jgi:hypothetical protein
MHRVNAHITADQSEIFAFLADPATHGTAEPVRRIDTHGAAVFLAGPDAYKVKRAVRFPFMDFSTLLKRKAACEREIKVNRGNAPGLYLGVLPITRSDGRLALDGRGEPVEWAVHMRRFDENATLDKVAERGGLSAELIAGIANAVLEAHRQAPRRDFDSAAALDGLVRENAASFAENPDLFAPERVKRLSGASQSLLERNRGLLVARRKAGYVRHCHGDLHLRNVVLLQGEPVLFDALEFDEALATTDILYDLAFLIMDLWERGFPQAANAVLNQYLWGSDDAQLEGLRLLPVLLSIRAAIRAKVVAASLPHLGEPERAKAVREAPRYFALAEECLLAKPAGLVAIGGLSGTGKTTIARELAPLLGRLPGSVHLRSDIERKRLFATAETEHLPQAGYAPDATARVYELVARKAKRTLAAGYGVVADAVHASPTERAGIEAAARAAGARFDGLWLETALPLRVERVEARRHDASDATADYVRRQAGIDVGEIAWRRVEAAGSVKAVLARATAALGIEADTASAPTG